MRQFLIVLALAASLSACRKRTATVYRGVPDAVRVACRSVNNSNTVYACVGGGRAYTCVDAPEEGDEKTWHSVLECARTSTLPTPEEPKDDDQ